MVIDRQAFRDLLFPSPWQGVKNLFQFLYSFLFWGIVWIAISLGILFIALT